MTKELRDRGFIPLEDITLLMKDPKFKDFFPYSEPNMDEDDEENPISTGQDNYYHYPPKTEIYWGLEWVPAENAYDLFSWGLNPNPGNGIRFEITEFQTWVQDNIGYTPTCSNF